MNEIVEIDILLEMPAWRNFVKINETAISLQGFTPGIYLIKSPIFTIYTVELLDFENTPLWLIPI